MPYLIHIIQGDQFSTGFVDINPNSKIPALVDRSGDTPINVFESGAILLYLAEKFGRFLPTNGAARATVLNWLFWLQGSAPYLGGGFGHFYAYAPQKIEYAINRFTMEVKRQLDVLDKQLASNTFIAGHEYSICRHGYLALVRQFSAWQVIQCWPSFWMWPVIKMCNAGQKTLNNARRYNAVKLLTAHGRGDTS